MPLSKCEVWKVKKPRFIKKETSGLLSKLGIKNFWARYLNRVIFWFTDIKMTEIVSFFLAANNSVSEIHFRQPEHTYSAFEPFNKKNQR